MIIFNSETNVSEQVENLEEELLSLHQFESAICNYKGELEY